MRKWGLLLIGLSFASQAMGQLSIPKIQDNSFQQHPAVNNALAEAGVLDATDDITDDQHREQITLSDHDIHEAKVWNLSLDEEKRYVQLMKNKSAIYYQGLNMTPLDILGLNAQNDDEREHFAELAAKQEAIKVAQNLAWNNAFHKAYNKLFEGIPVVGDFDPAPFSPLNYKPLRLSAGESLYLFVKPDDAIKTVLMMLIEAISETPNTQLNFLFLDMDEESIQVWASRHEIPYELVRGKRITLNQGELAYEALVLKKKSTPLLLLAKNGTSTPVDLGRF